VDASEVNLLNFAKETRLRPGEIANLTDGA
jgi:hypothetical protein